MGYDTILSRVFIKVDDERFIPYVNSRVSNCTTISPSGREVKVQENYPLNMGKKRNVLTLQEVNEWIESQVASKLKANQSYDWTNKTEEAIRENLGWETTFYLSGKKFMSDKQIYTWFKNAFKAAYTIEDLKEIYSNVSFKFMKYGTNDVLYINTTEELIKALDDDKYNDFQFYIDWYDTLYKSIQRVNKLKRLTNSKPKENKAVSEYYYVGDGATLFIKHKRKVMITYDVEEASKFQHKSQAEIFAKRLKENYGRKNSEVRTNKLNEPQLIHF